MKEELGGYETRLLAELTEVVARPRRRLFTMPRLAIGGVALAALAVTGGLTLPVFGGASERSPNSGVVAAPPPVEPVGFSLSVANDEVTVTVDFIDDDEALEAALLEEGVDANVVILRDGESCTGQDGEGIAPAGDEAEGEGASSITLNVSDFDDARLQLVIYTLPGGGVSAMMIRSDVPVSDDCSTLD